MVVVVPDGYESLSCVKARETLGLVKGVHHINSNPLNSVEAVVNQFPDIFKGFGVLLFTYKIQLKDYVKTVAHAPQ